MEVEGLIKVTVLLHLLVCGIVYANECGIRNTSSEKIVGGRKAKECEFPWQVSLQVNGYHFCGGSIIAPDTVVTAAHCLGGRASASSITVMAGSIDLRKKGASYQQRRVKWAAPHDAYGSNGMGEDIALLKLEEPFDLDASDGCLAAVCLPKSSYQVRGNVVVSGWGTTREGGSLSTELLAVSVPVTNDGYCAIQYLQIGTLTTAYDKKTMFCAGEPFGGKDSCQGDSGGPAIQYQNGTAILVGIVSFGQGCARLTHAGVYTRVSNYVDWMEQQTME